MEAEDRSAKSRRLPGVARRPTRITPPVYRTRRQPSRRLSDPGSGIARGGDRDEERVPDDSPAESALVMAAGSSTFKVKACLAVPDVLAAVTVMGWLPPLPVAGVPAMAAVPFPWSVKFTPSGSDPDSVTAGTGYPVAARITGRDSGQRSRGHGRRVAGRARQRAELPAHAHPPGRPSRAAARA